MTEQVADQRGTGERDGSAGSGGGGATGHGGAGALTGPSSTGFDSGTSGTTHRVFDETGGHLTDQSDQERELLGDAADDPA
jgi:hypothetical protein